MGNAASQQVGSVLAEVDIVLGAAAKEDEMPSMIPKLPAFTEWAKASFGDIAREDMLLLLREVRHAKHRHFLSMGLFPTDASCGGCAGDNDQMVDAPSWFPSYSWNPKASGCTDIRSYDTGVVSGKEVPVYSDNANERCPAHNIEIEINTSCPQGVEHAPGEAAAELNSLANSKILCDVILRVEELTYQSIEDVYGSVSLGDHIFYVDREGGRFSMEHHMIVVKKFHHPSKEETSEQERPAEVSILGIGVLPGRWAHTTLSFIDLGAALRKGNMGYPLHRVSASLTGCTQEELPSAPTVVDLALASVGMSHCWNGASFNCEDWANWVTTGWAFSVQRMRAVYRGSLFGDVLVTHIPNIDMHHSDVASTVGGHGRKHGLRDLPTNAKKLRDVRIGVFQGLSETENF